jgi:hypothetical protein
VSKNLFLQFLQVKIFKGISFSTTFVVCFLATFLVAVFFGVVGFFDEAM